MLNIDQVQQKSLVWKKLSPTHDLLVLEASKVFLQAYMELERSLHALRSLGDNFSIVGGTTV